MSDVVPLRPAPTLNAQCADCGADVVWDPVRDRWGSKVLDNDRYDAWSFTCRIVRHPTNDWLVIAADYHYVHPDAQQHFRLGKGVSRDG